MAARTLLLLALLALILLAFICLPKTAQQIETDLSQRSVQTLSAAGLSEIEVSADGQTVVLNGIVPSLDTKHQAEQLVARETGVISVDNQLQVTTDTGMAASVKVVATTDYENVLEFNGDQLLLTGAVTDAKIKAEIGKRAQTEFGEDKVINNLSIAKDASPLVAGMIRDHLITRLKDFSNVKVVISDSRLSVTGEAETVEQRDQLREALSEGVPRSYLPIFSINVAGDTNRIAATQCQNQFAKLLGKEKIRFAVNQAVISPPSHKLLSTLARVAAKCPDAHIEIAGHTDSSGSARYNQALSQRRAQAVVDFLASRKVSKKQLKAKGYGEVKPIADNSTEKGKAQNRRIEFRVITK